MDNSGMFIFYIFFGVVKVYSQSTLDSQCQHNEIVSCGDAHSIKRWEFCKPKRVDIKRILSVHLDLRYPTKYCRKLGKPQNFGLTENGEVWVANFCFGTFFLCLQTDTPIITSTDAVKTSTELSTDTLESSFTSTTDDTMTSKQVDVNIEKQDISGNRENDRLTLVHEQMGKTIVAETTTAIRNSQFDMPEVHHISEAQSDPNENSLLEFNKYTKVVLIASIVTGGAILISLILAIAYLTKNCSLKRSESNNSTEQNLSTSTLMTQQPSSLDQSVYDFIPCDVQPNKRANDKAEHPDHQSNSRDAPEASNNYFILLPPDTKIEQNIPEINKIYNRVTVENEYDQLQSVHRPSVTDNSTYSRLVLFSKDNSTDDNGNEMPVKEANETSSYNDDAIKTDHVSEMTVQIQSTNSENKHARNRLFIVKQSSQTSYSHEEEDIIFEVVSEIHKESRNKDVSAEERCQKLNNS